ncbi:hypothetical protein HPB49_008637 [Dermacentor silvarum]|uniref:Uncharacterized protein n=1 Tax=Dermacentor silvarum TaxID=543639 RepID=A0ACB8DXV0_DERSI|nr:hypothetical protein HPB49_008637 [Dermacentor silvarum]
MLNSNGGAGAANGLHERALDSGAEQRLQIREWNTTCAAGSRRKQKFYLSGAGVTQDTLRVVIPFRCLFTAPPHRSLVYSAPFTCCLKVRNGYLAKRAADFVCYVYTVANISVKDKGNSTKRRHVHVLGRTQDAVTELCKVKRGIQGHHNSCYLDATLFAMFSCTYIFDDILNREHQPNDIDGYDRIQKVLRDDIVNTLRSDLYVPSENVMRLRELLDSLGGVSGLTTEEKDPEEFLNSLFSALKVQPFLKLSSQQETHLYQLFVAKNELLEIPTVQQLFHQSIHESKLKLKEIPKALIIQMPRCGKQFKLYDHIVPSLKLDITDALENSPRFCYVCGRQATQECWNCFRPDVGLECTSYCDSCNKTVHQHQDRDGHKQTALSNDRFGEDAQPRRQVMTLFAVVCIETSHYVCFVKCPVEDGKNTHTWCFFDSMADREG